MIISEEKIKYQIDIFAEYMSEMSDEVSSDIILEDKDADEISGIILEYFLENYHQPTLKEAAFNCITGIDPNQELYQTIAELFLDETIGGFIAGAANFVGNAMAKRSANKASNAYNKANTKSTKVANKAASTTSNGIVKAFRNARANKFNAKTSLALNKSKAANTNHQDRLAKTDAMKQRIDNKISSVKNGIKNAPKTIAGAVGSFSARFA